MYNIELHALSFYRVYISPETVSPICLTRNKKHSDKAVDDIIGPAKKAESTLDLA